MIEIEIPKDISKYEAKLVASFTTRQVACLVIAGAITVPTFLALGKVAPRDVCSIVVLLEAIPFVLLGWIKPYGMNFEQFIRTAFISNVLAPKKRKYVTMNIYDYIEDAEFNDEKAAKQRKLMTQKEMQQAMDEKIKTNIKYYV